MADDAAADERLVHAQEPGSKDAVKLHARRVFWASIAILIFSTAFWIWAMANSIIFTIFDSGNLVFPVYIIAGVVGVYASIHVLPSHCAANVAMTSIGALGVVVAYAEAAWQLNYDGCDLEEDPDCDDKTLKRETVKLIWPMCLWLVTGLLFIYWAVKHYKAVRVAAAVDGEGDSSGPEAM